jgi:GNAT superfamily N-acetyltransferase
VCHPPASFRPDTEEAAELLMSACLARLARWNVRARYASGDLPAPVVYGLPRTWPHIRAVYERAGFRRIGDTEVILVAAVADPPGDRLPPGVTRAGFRRVGDTEVILVAAVADPPGDRLPPGVTVERTLGACGTRLTARADGHALGLIEVDTALERPERHTRAAGLADIATLHIEPAHHDTALERALLAQAARWLRLCGVDRLFACGSARDLTMTGPLTGAGFEELTRTDPGWEHRRPRRRPQIPGR